MTYTLQREPGTPARQKTSTAGFLVVALLIVTCISILFLLSWSMDKGFDITDESYNLNFYTHADAYKSNAHGTYLLIRALTDSFSPTLIDFRWTKLMMQVLAAIVLALSFLGWLRANFKLSAHEIAGLAGIIPAFVVMTLSSNSLGVNIVNYDSVAGFCLYLSASIILFNTSAPPDRLVNSLPRLLSVSLCGLLVVVAVYPKYPTACLLAFANVVWLSYFLYDQPARDILKVFSFFLIGLILSAIASLFLIPGTMPWLYGLVTEVRNLSDDAYSLSTLLLAYSLETAAQLKVLFLYFGVPLAIIAISTINYRDQSYSSRTKRLTYYAAAATCTVLIAYSISLLRLYDLPYFNNTKTSVVYLFFLVSILTIFVAVEWKSFKPINLKPFLQNRRGIVSGVAILFIMPFLASFGTLNNLWINVLLDIIGWFALITLIALMIARHKKLRWVVYVYVLLPVLFGTFQIVNGVVINPYALAHPLYEQTETLREPVALAGIRVDKPTAAFLEDIRKVFGNGGFQNGDPIIALYNLPGIVHAAGGFSPGTPAFFDRFTSKNKQTLRDADFKRTDAYLILSRPLSREVCELLQIGRVPFPANYVVIGKVENPYADARFPVLQNDHGLTIFAPTSRVSSRAHTSSIVPADDVCADTTKASDTK